MILRALLLVSIAVSAAAAQAPSIAHAKLLFEARSYDAARGEFTALALGAPSDVTPLVYLGRIAQAQNDADGALRQFERCVAIDERMANCHFFIGEVVGSSAATASKFKLPFLAKRTRREFERAVQLDPGYLDARMGLIQYYLRAPGFLGGSVDQARVQAAEIDKRSTLRGPLAWGAIAEHENDERLAEAHFLKAIAAQPDSAVGYNVLVNLYARDKRWPEAFATLDRLAARHGDPNVLLAIARLAAQSGEQLGKGEEAAKRWLASPPTTASAAMTANAHVRLAQVYEKGGKREQARAELEKALVSNARNEEAKRGVERLK